VWSDEFNYQGLPDPAKWDYEEGFVRNHEKQYYTRGRPENARVENGMLVLECRKEEYTPAKHSPVAYTSASLVTRESAGWLYGRIEVRAKLPQGKGVWPAIWTLGTNMPTVGWPACGEIDILEYVGKDPDLIHATIHYAGDDGKHKMNHKQFTTAKPYNDFHTYAIEWFPDRIDFYFDNTKFQTALLDKADLGAENPFRKPHKLLINLALGGSWGGEIEDAAANQKYLIDYVRIYKDANAQ
jgi:beta-glucanase (GH16 family)